MYGGTLLLLFVSLTWSIPLKSDEEVLEDARVKRNGVAVPYWWLPGSSAPVDASISSVSCGDPGTPAFGNSLFQSMAAGSLVVHSCKPGYKLVGAKLRLCQSNRQWTPEIPTCMYVDCGDPGTPFQGSRQISSTSLDSIVKYNCNKDFRLVGDGFRQCQANGQWTGSLPTCQAIGCPSLEVSNCKVQVDFQGIGAVATFVCLSGYVLVGSSSMTCGAGGVWVGKMPTCKLIDCGPLPAPQNGDVTYKDSLFGSVALYECRSGFAIQGVSTRKCQQSGKWSDSAPVCNGAQLCSQLRSTGNLQVVVSGTTMGSTASYTCINGFQLAGARVRTCMSGGVWSDQEPTCKPVDCGKVNPPANGHVAMTSTTVASVAYYSCNAGYVLNGSRNRECLSTGQWASTEPTCQAISCSKPVAPQNGRVDFTSVNVGSIATYTCSLGFSLSGSSTQTCLSTGLWSPEAPTCTAVRCSAPRAPANGQVITSGTAVGSVATYSCNTGYTLIGSSTQTCQSNAQWSGDAPSCSLSQCGELKAPLNGYVNMTGAFYGSTVQVGCNSGYILIGDAARTCQSNGLWSGSMATCQAVDCGFADNVANAQMTQKGSTVGSITTYQCVSGFVMSGQATRVCMANGQWSASAPTCDPVDCGPLKTPANAVLSVTTTTLGSVAIYTCSSGQISALTRRVCLASGKWSDNEPTCEAPQCITPSPPLNGGVTVSGLSIGSTATYTCLPGFSMVGTETRQCQQDTMWSSTAPMCQAIICDVLTPPDNGRVSTSGTTVGSTATYSCFPGFNLQGAATAQCQSTGKWVPSPPTCSLVDCGDLQAPSFGTVTLSGTTYGSTATYACNDGYMVAGMAVRVCQSNKNWSGVAPTCNPSPCGQLQAPLNGNVAVTGINFGDTATYTCNTGYFLVGQATRKCALNGQWTNAVPFCQAVDCGQLPPPKDGSVSVVGTSYGSKAFYKCSLGFDMVGVADRTCGASGVWSGDQPLCQRVSCGSLTPPQDGDISFSNGLLYGSLATYTCVKGAILVGNAARLCGSNKQWTGVDPTCDLGARCPLPSYPTNGKVNITSTAVGAAVYYTCNSGYVLQGPRTRLCQNNGKWTGSDPSCQISGCPALMAPQFGDIKVTGTAPGSVATYSCRTGYRVVSGDLARTCGNDGNWSGDQLSCKAITCDSLQSPVNGVVSLSGNSFRDTATYSCNPGYVLYGNGIRECGMDGQWGGKAAECKVIDCGPLKAPTNGDIKVAGTTFGYTARYTCNNGFVLNGFSTRVCQVTGKWLGDDPQCTSQPCSQLPPPDNGAVMIANGVATYSCNAGFALIGASTRQCQSGGVWSDTPPTCGSIDCGEIQAIENGKFLYSRGTAVNSVATYSCNPGYTLVGSATSICQQNGNWLGSPPVCQVVDCGSLQAPLNGKVQFTDTTLGATATYSCNQGYLLVGTQQRNCKSQGMWTGDAPSCAAAQVFSCTALPDPENGRVFYNDTTPGSQAIYVCNDGFSLSGAETRTCVEQDGWSERAPTCIAVTCGPLEFPLNGRVIQTGTVFGSIALYNCDEGYTLTGSVTRTCQPVGLWSGIEPYCAAVDCGTLVSPTNGAVNLIGTTLGSVARYTCNPSFRLVGDASRTCLSTARWSGNQPSCNSITASSCGDPGTPVNGVRIGDDFRLGATVYYTCNANFDLVGPGSRTCQGSGAWSDALPICTTSVQTVDCGVPTKPAQGTISLTSTTVGSTAVYACNFGFILNGDASRICQPTGQWSGQQPTCSSAPLMSCGNPGTPGNGIRTGDSFSIGATVQYSCLAGFKLIGDNIITCQSDGTWSASLPMCARSLIPEVCKNGDQPFDSCQRQCQCVNGNIVNCCTLRRDYSSLSAQEKDRYTRAVFTLATDPAYKPLYDALVAKHKASFNTAAQSTNTAISKFLIWNRYFMLEYEKLLQQIDCRISIPYWDWSALPSTPYAATIWSASSGFGDASDPQTNCVSNGPLRFDIFNVTPSAGGGCLLRQYKSQSFPSRSIIERDMLTIAPSNFDNFLKFVQVYVHANVRCFVGGHMCSNDAANDPVYLSHLAQLDSIYDRWQSFSPANLAARYSSDTSIIPLADNLRVQQYSNNQNLPGGARVCYDHPYYKSHAPPSSQFMSDVPQGTSVSGTAPQMDCIGSEQMMKLNMSAEAIQFMASQCGPAQK